MIKNVCIRMIVLMMRKGTDDDDGDRDGEMTMPKSMKPSMMIVVMVMGMLTIPFTDSCYRILKRVTMKTLMLLLLLLLLLLFTALSPEELTQGFLLHEEQLALLQHQVSIVFKFPADAPMARSLMNAVREWQAEHKAGAAHPWGSCAHYTAAALLKELAKIEDPPQNFSTADNRNLQKVVKELGPDLHESLVHMVSYCSARLSAKKEHVILDYRPVLNTTLARHSELISGLLDSCEGERLGKRAPGSLVRKARGKPSDR